MKDFLGREIEAGDSVVFAYPTSTCNFEYRKGYVHKIVKRKDGDFVEIEIFYPYHSFCRKRVDKVLVTPRSIDDFSNSELKFILTQRNIS